MLIAAAFIFLQTIQAQPSAPQADDLRIVGVEQTGKPPFEPEGRIYRLAGESFERIRPGEILLLKRPKEERTIGSLRVLAVQPESLTASLEVRGETFPLKGDFAFPLNALDLPNIFVGDTSRMMKEEFGFPLNPFGMPLLPRSDRYAEVGGAILPPDAPRPLHDIVLSFISDAEREDAEQADKRPKIVAQNAFYFDSGSSELSPKGLNNLRQWTDEWNNRGLKYFLAVPEDQLKLQKLLVERLTVLQIELQRLGIADVGIRADVRNIKEPFDTIYVGVER